MPSVCKQERLGIAGAEVVDGDFDAEMMNGIESRARLLALEEAALRGFNLDVCGTGAAHAEQLFENVRRSVRNEDPPPKD